jgi:hypothetical protein
MKHRGFTIFKFWELTNLWSVVCLFAATVFLSYQNAYSSGYCADIYRSETQLLVPSQKKRLEGLLSQSQYYRAQLENAHLEIVKIEDEIANSGNTHRGVYRVRLKSGESLVLKIASESPEIDNVSIWDKSTLQSTLLGSFPRKFNETLVIQNFLASFGVAPKIHGILSSTQLNGLYPQLAAVNPFLDKQDFRSKKWVGIVMDEMKDPWNGAGSVPINYKFPENNRKFMAKIRNVYEVLQYFQIYVADLQIFINPRGEAFVADLDFSVYARGVPLDYSNFAKNHYDSIKESILRSAPFGWRFDTNRRLQIKAEEQVLAEKILDLKSKGLSDRDVAVQLNLEHPFSLRRKRWKAQDVNRVFDVHR